MAEVLMYSKSTCPFCMRALALFDQFGQDVDVVDINKQPERRDEMIKKASGGRTVPQIFIDGKHIGGCDDLYALHAQGGLKPLLRS